MRIPKSQFGLTFLLLYILGSIYLIVTQGLFGESFVAITLGLPWSFLLVLSNINIPVYIFVLAPIVLNAVLLYWIGAGIQKLFPIKYRVVGITVVGFVFGSIILSPIVSFGLKGVSIFESLAPLAAPGTSISKQLITTKESSSNRLIINPGSDTVESIQDLIRTQGRPSPLAWLVTSVINGIVYSFLFWLFYLLASRLAGNAQVRTESISNTQ